MTSISSPMLPIERMTHRAELARQESDTAYFFDLLYLGEMILKLLVAELVSGLDEDRNRQRYAAEFRLVRANGIGEWTDVLDEVLTGPASQRLTASARESQRALSAGFAPRSDEWQRVAVDMLNKACRCLDAEIADLSGQRVSMRNWARTFVWLRNRTRGHGSPRSVTLSTVCPALLNSLEAIVENAPAFGRDWAYLKRNLSGRYRVSMFGGSRDPFEHLTKEAEASLPDGVYLELDGLRRASLLVSDADLTDFFLPNGNYRKSQIELLSYITDETKTVDASDWGLPVESQPASETAAAPDLDVIGEVLSNMPPRREGYVSRPELEAELRSVLADARNPVVTLQGRGGVGKTSLALEVLHQISTTQDFFAVVWFSARDIDLLPDGAKVVRADVLNTDDVARDFSDLLRPGVGMKVNETHQFFTDCLAGRANDGPFIFVFDNFETIREQADLYSYVNNAIRLPNKVLITTRTRDFKADYPIQVSGMTWAEYQKLVSEVSKRLEVVELVTPEYEHQLFEESDGHPYITKVLLGEVAREARQVSLKHVVAAKDALLDALFDRSFAALAPAAQRIFLTLCSWRSLVPRLGLEAVVLRPGNERMDVQSALSELEKSSLVEQLVDPESDTDFLSVPLAAALFGKRKLVTSPLKVAIEADLELVRYFGPMSVTDVSLGLEPRLERLARAISQRMTVGDAREELGVMEYIATDYPPAWLHMAALQQESGNTSAALDSVNRYLESNPSDVEAWRLAIVLYRKNSDTLGELHARLQLAELGRPAFHELSTTASRLNGILSRHEIELVADERRLMVGKLRHLVEARVQEADATDLSRLAWLCMHDHDSAAASKWAEQGLILDPGNEHCLRIVRRLAAGQVEDTSL